MFLKCIATYFCVFFCRQREIILPPSDARSRCEEVHCERPSRQRHSLSTRCATPTSTMSRGPSLAWYIFFSSTNPNSLTGAELDVRESLQPLAALSRRGGKRSRLYELIKVPLPATLDCKAAHSRLSWRLYQRENVQALVSAHYPPRRASTARTDGGLYN